MRCCTDLDHTKRNTTLNRTHGRQFIIHLRTFGMPLMINAVCCHLHSEHLKPENMLRTCHDWSRTLTIWHTRADDEDGTPQAPYSIAPGIPRRQKVYADEGPRPAAYREFLSTTKAWAEDGFIPPTPRCIARAVPRPRLAALQ